MQLNKDSKLTRIFRCWTFYRKRFKSSKAFIFIIFNTQNILKQINDGRRYLGHPVYWICIEWLAPKDCFVLWHLKDFALSLNYAVDSLLQKKDFGFEIFLWARVHKTTYAPVNITVTSIILSGGQIQYSGDWLGPWTLNICGPQIALA